MIKTRVTPVGVVRLLNQCVKLDREATDNLISQRVDCNEALADHPTVQVRGVGSGWQVGLLGVLNGLFGIAEDGYGPIAGVYDLVCPSGCKGEDLVAGGVSLREELENLAISDLCPICGTQLILGDLLRFEVIRKPGD